MDEAVDDVVETKFGPAGSTRTAKLFARIYKGDFGDRYLAEAATTTRR